MIVLHITTGLETGGAELVLERIIMQQRRDGRFQHRVISLRTLGTVGPRLQAAGIPVEAIGMLGPIGLAWGFVRLIRRIAQIRPDVVTTWMYHADLVGGVAAWLAGSRRILWSIRISDISPALGVSRSQMWARRLSVPLSRIVPRKIHYVAESARQVHEALGYDPAKSVVVPNGYAVPPPAEAAAARSRVRAELGLGDGGILIGSAGRFSPQKGYRGFVAAAAAVARRFPQTRFLMFGRGVSWENEELAGWIRDTGLADRFHVLGERRDVLDQLAALDIFALFSLGEGFPNIVAEAMSVGTPCVVTDVGDAALLVADTGIVIKPRDVGGLTTSLERLIAAGEAERRRLGEAGRRRVETAFSLSATVESYAKLFEEVAGEAAAEPRGPRPQRIEAR